MHIAAGLRLHQRLTDQHLDAFVIGDAAVDDQPVMAVRGIRVERDVADDADLGHRLLDGAHRAADQIVGINGLAGVIVAQLGVGEREERDGRDVQARRFLGGGDAKIHRHAVDAGHRGHGNALIGAFQNEERPDQIAGRQMVLAHQTA